MQEGGGSGAVCTAKWNRFYLPSGQTFLQAPAVKIPTRLQLPEALVTWRSICTLETERNLVLCCKSCLPAVLRAVEGISNAARRCAEGLELPAHRAVTPCATLGIHCQSLGVILSDQEKPECRFTTPQ